MADAIVPSAIQWIASLLAQEVRAFFDLEDHVRSVKEELEILQQYLQGADAKKEVQKNIHPLINQIQRLAYDAEDVLDTYVIEVESKSEQRSENWVRRCTCFLYTTPSIYKVRKQIDATQFRLTKVKENLIAYKVSKTTKSVNGTRTRRTCPYDDDDGGFVVGLDKDIPELVEVLMGEGKHQVNFLSIVGMGGSGKTTLAKKLYNHKYIKECFDHRAWVFISQEWSAQHVLSEILRNVGGPKEHAESSVEELVDMVRNALVKKPYLVVLDDVWNPQAVQEILPALPRENMDGGSKIIITTRNKKNVEFLNRQRNLHVHKSHPLNEEEGWELLSGIALHDPTNDNMETFENLGKEMLKKCDGLPLAIVALAGILSTKSSFMDWQDVNEAVQARVMEGQGTHGNGKVEDILALSYDDLPYDLKPCFLHLAVFPEDCPIPAGMLTRMWIAEGLIATHEHRSLEDIAAECLEELSNRFLVQVVRRNYRKNIKAIHLHDLLRNLCVKKAQEQSFLKIYTPTSTRAGPTTQPRRAALHSSTNFPLEVSHLRSLVLLSQSSILHSAYASKDMLDLCVVSKSFKLLRLLNLWGIKTVSGTLPAEIGSLIHLRYLGVRATNITELPTSIGNLRNLLTLDYRNVDSNDTTTITIPKSLGNLKLLRHLFLPVEYTWNVQELKLSNLKSLQTLWGVKQERDCHWLAQEIKILSITLKKLKIVVSREADLKDTLSCPRLKDNKLHTLHYELRDGIALHDVGTLSDLQHLYKLVLSGKLEMRHSLMLPRYLVKLELKDSLLDDVDSAIALGRLIHLKSLRMSNSYVRTVFPCKSGSFHQLEELYLENLHNLGEWRIEEGAMPVLKKLEIIRCNSFKTFPEGLTYITSLQEFNFFEVPEEFSKRATELGWSQKKSRLPHNYEAIMGQCDSPINVSSIRNLYEQLIDGVFLNNKKKRYWVVKQNDFYYNCFMVYAEGLTFDNAECWDWNEITESETDGTSPKVASLESLQCVSSVSGSIDIADLSPVVTYNISYVMMIKDSAVGWQKSVECRFAFPGGGRHKHKRLNFNDMPKNKWTQTLVGDFEISRKKKTGSIRFSLDFPSEWPPAPKKGLVIKGVIIEANP